MDAEKSKKERGILGFAPRSGQVPIILLTIFISGIVILIAGGFTKTDYRVVPALIWAFGCCVSGMLLGFLFAIPRTLPSGAIVAPAPAQNNAPRTDTPPARIDYDTKPVPGHNEINSNLVEVSDWLTKIIVGVGLVELKDLPRNAESVAFFIAPSLGIAIDSAVSIAGGIILFFSILGFLIGYLLTRIYLAVIIKWADNMVKIQNEPVRLRSGREIDIGELSLLQQDALSDLQWTVAELASAIPLNDASIAKIDTPPSTSSAKEVLWVDDRPENNTLLVEQLTNVGVKVEQVRSTQEALKFITTKHYDAIVSDMGRMEGKNYVGDAGIVLAQEVRRLAPNVPLMVFTNAMGAKLHGAAAKEAGVRLVTASGTRLIDALNKILNLSNAGGSVE